MSSLPFNKEIFLAVFLLLLMVLCVKFRKLTLTGSLAAAIIGVSVYLAADWKGVLLLLVFFILSVIATAHKKQIKATVHGTLVHSEGRTPGQVFANGGMAAIFCLISLWDPSHSELYLLMMAASLASALSDTLSSELGIVYGRHSYNIITFKRDERGLDGVISLEGTIIGAGGSFFVGLAFAGLTTTVLVVGLAGLVGNLIDSLLGALLERRGIIGNNFVNFLNTLCAALFAMVLYFLNIT